MLQSPDSLCGATAAVSSVGSRDRTHVRFTDANYARTFTRAHRLVDLVVKASASRAADLGSIPAFAVELFLSRVMSVTSKR